MRLLHTHPFALTCACAQPTAAALKVGDNLADFPDYFRALPSTSGSQVTTLSSRGSDAL